MGERKKTGKRSWNTMENNMEVSKKKIDLPYNLAILLLSIDPKEMETGY